MNHMAKVQAVQRAPEIIVVNDGKPVENVGAAGKGAQIAKMVGPAVAAIVVGVIIGRISKDANFYNAGLSDAKEVLGDSAAPGAATIRGSKKALNDLDTKLEAIKTGTKFRYDKKSTDELAEFVAKLDVKPESGVFKAKQNALDAELSGRVVQYYATIAEVKALLEQHLKQAKADVQSLLASVEADKNALPEEKVNEDAAKAAPKRSLTKYAIVATAPTACATGDDGEKKDKKCDTDLDPYGAQLVEIGPPYCGTEKDSKLNLSGKCAEGEPIAAWGYRTEPGKETWTKGILSTDKDGSIATKRLVPLLATGIREAVIRGGDPGASEVYYKKRMEQLLARTKEAVKLGNSVQESLEKYASQGARFSFFL